jgi:hypothetical protein
MRLRDLPSLERIVRGRRAWSLDACTGIPLMLSAEFVSWSKHIRWTLTTTVDLGNLTQVVGGIDGGPGFQVITFTRMITRLEVKAGGLSKMTFEVTKIVVILRTGTDLVRVHTTLPNPFPVSVSSDPLMLEFETVVNGGETYVRTHFGRESEIIDARS